MAESVHVTNRDQTVKALRKELVGPSPQGEELDCSGAVVFPDVASALGPFRQAGCDEEILMRDPPRKRYGVGVLYPMEAESKPEQETNGEQPEPPSTPEEVLTEQAAQSLAEIEQRAGRGNEPEPDDFDLSSANRFNPSSMGVSFLAEFPPGAKLVVEVPEKEPVHRYRVNGRYRKKDVSIAGETRTWFLRQPVYMRAEFAAEDLCPPKARKLVDEAMQATNLDRLDLRIEVYSRPTKVDHQRLVTISLVNRQNAAGIGDDLASLFQAYFRVWIEVPGGSGWILPYPTASLKQDSEEQSLALLYRRFETYATGHGCAADWPSTGGEEGRVAWVSAECLPTFETPSMTPNIYRKGGKEPLRIAMSALAGLVPGDDGVASLAEIVQLYEQWIADQRRQIPLLPDQHQTAAERHMEQCRQAAARMREGLAYLKDEQAVKAFRLANHAIILQQYRGRPESRKVGWDDKTRRITFSEPAPVVDPSKPQGKRGYWRPFQIAFFLMALRSAAEGKAPDRENVELIWFPTGGGKTEAYLGLAAFAIFIRRLKNPQDDGTHVLMRYTLRLLTAQQFQRASGLIVAMEHLRRARATELGQSSFSIGVWLGSDSTPNKRDAAVKALVKLNKDPAEENPFILTRCPWCSAQLGPLKQKLKIAKAKLNVIGYEPANGTVVFKCPDSSCEFKSGLPVHVIDEDIYASRPTLVIGTVDKFANLAWRPEARYLFGLNEDGSRHCSPPGLIIQDELHLIAGPLGSMVGLYEAVIEELCTDYRVDPPVGPKLVCSTATIRRYEDQVKALYGRTGVTLFPPPGLDTSNSFFACYETADDGTPARGRMYVGVHGPGLGSMQTAQVRSFSALLQAPVSLPTPAEQDPWWSLLIFFNSLRELGTTLTLLQSDIPDYFGVLRLRFGRSADLRRFENIKELTSRLRGDEVPEAIAQMSVACGSPGASPVDVCLSSNIIEVGVDIDRLSLMSIVGQPKSTSQYIQVSGRVGRQGAERPGLVVTLYGASKPRDRSHFEKFRSYHERLYAQVEPTSVTPFSPPVLDRALHAVMVAYARQTGPKQLAWTSPDPYPQQLMNYLRQLLIKRILVIDPEELPNFEKVFKKRTEQWKKGDRTLWSASWQSAEIPLLRVAGAYATEEQEKLSWPTPLSMRNVDAECLATITNAYLLEGSEEH